MITTTQTSEKADEVNGTPKKKHVTMEKPLSRSSSPKIKAASSSAAVNDIRNRYLMIFHYLFIEKMKKKSTK